MCFKVESQAGALSCIGVIDLRLCVSICVCDLCRRVKGCSTVRWVDTEHVRSRSGCNPGYRWSWRRHWGWTRCHLSVHWPGCRGDHKWWLREWSGRRSWMWWKDYFVQHYNMFSCLTYGIMKYLRTQTGVVPDHRWSCWQILTDVPMRRYPSMHWYTTVSR